MKKDNKSEGAILRQRAEELIKRNLSKSGSQLSEAEMQKLIHELEVHQIELEMQNEEILLSKNQAELATEKYTELYDLAPSGYFTLSEKGNIIDLNLSGSEMLGKERSFIKNNSFEFFVTNDTRPDFNLFLEKVFTNKDKVTCEVNLSTISNLPMNAHLTGIVTENREQCLVTVIDITNRKQTEEALRTSETHLRTLVQTIPDLIWLKDTDGVYLSCNTMFERFFGAREADIVGKTDYDYVDRELADFFRENDRKVMAAGKPTNNEEWVNFADDGHRAYLDTIKTPMYNSSGTLIGMLGIGRDLTERKRAEEALRKSEAHFKTIFNEAPLGIALIDSLTGHVYTVNPMFAKITDRTVDEMTNIEWMSITHPDDVQEDLDNMALMNAGKISGFQMEKRYLHHDGTPVWINMTIAPIYVEDKAHPRHLCMIEDITKRKKEEEALRRSEAIQAKMVANIGDVIVIIDKDGINRYKSPNIEKWFGWSPEEVVGASTWENVHPEDVDSLQILFNTLVEKPNTTGTTEIRYRCKDGSFKWIEFTVVNLLNDPDIRGLLSNYHDITERKHTKETLRLSEERYRVSLEITGQIGWSIPPDGLVEDMPLWRQYTGQSIEEVKGWKWLDSIHPDDREHTHNIWVKAIAQKCKYETEYRIRRADGVYRYFMVRGIPLFNTNGSVKEWVGTCIDITERKHAEETLLKLSSAIEQTVDSIMITDRDGTIEYVNHAFEVLTGYPAREAMGKTPRILKSGTRDQKYYEAMWKTILSGKVFSDEVVNKKKNGDLFDEEKTISPIFDKNKTITHFVGTGVDITKRKELELKMELDRQVQEALNKILNISVENISLEESLERILITIISLPFLNLENKGGVLLTEEGQNILTLKTSYNLSKEIQTMCAQVPFGHCLCGRAAATRQIQFVDCVDEGHENSYERMKPHGHYNVPILTSDSVLGVIVVYTDEYHKQEKYEQDFLFAIADILSGLIQSERAKIELIEAKEKAQESDRLKSSFLANMSHEVRTPLNSIIGFSELLADPFFEEEQKSEFIQSIITSGKNLLTIISDIMDISKMESGEIKIRKSQINAQKFISTVKEEFAIQTEEKKLELKLNHPDNDDETVIYADAERLRQIFNNLMSNAIKFTVIGSIEIGFQPKGKMVEFYVKDTGIGIPVEYHDNIFERFRQVETEKTRKYGGNGLGLAICKNLVELMGGKIWLKSESGKGSVFYFTLPAQSLT